MKYFTDHTNNKTRTKDDRNGHHEGFNTFEYRSSNAQTSRTLVVMRKDKFPLI